MKKTTLLVIFCITAFTTSFSQTKQESIKELIHIMGNDSMMNKTMDAMIPSMVNQMQSQMKDSTAKARSLEIAKIAMESAKEIMPKMMDEMAASYDKYFTEKEIKAFIAFYKTQPGQKYISVMPEMMKDVMGNMMKYYLPAMKTSIQTKMQDFGSKK
jgi:hypothetical protein